MTSTREPARVPSARAAASVTPDTGRLADFEITGQLGRGAQSTVYRVRRSQALDPNANRPEYALKLLDRTLADSNEAVTAFRREAALLASVNHPGLTRMHEVGVIDRRPYLVMDLVEGTSLEDVLANGALAPEKVIALALDVVDPLAAVHAKGLVHRDLKPPNVMVLAGGEARLIDFGLTAREGDGDGDERGPLAVGTLAYSAPEQSGMLKRPVDNRSDLYSLGVIMFEALAGVLPFTATDVGELLRMHAVVPAPDLTELVSTTPPALAEVVATLLAKDPDDRYQSGEDLAADLRALAGSPRQAATGSAAIGQIPLYGRTRELGVLTHRWAEVKNGHGGICLIRGAGGVGKSRLAAELANQARDAGSTVLRARAVPDNPVPFAPIRDALLDHLQAIARMPVSERWRRRAKIRSACVGWSASMLGRIAPGLEAILNGSDTLKGKDNLTSRSGLRTRSGAPGSPGSPAPVPERSGDGGAAAEEENENQFAVAVAGFLAGLARSCGDLMLILDDVQWLDPGTRQVLAHLGADIASVPVLVVATARDEADSAEGVAQFGEVLGRALDIDLTIKELDELAVGNQIKALIPGLSVDSRLVDLLAVRSNGNPFVAQEYLRAVIDAGLLRPSWGTWQLDEEGLDALELPQDAVGLVLTRVQNLSPDSRTMLVTAAGIGNDFLADTVAVVQGRDHEEVRQGLAEAARHRLVELREGGSYAFLHERIREALLADLDAAQLGELHRLIAEALDAAQVSDPSRVAEHAYAVAHHYMQCDPSIAPARAFAACATAGRLALDNHAPGEAVAFLEHAAKLVPNQPSSFLVVLGSALKQTGHLQLARERLEQALQVEAGLIRRAEIFTLLAEVHRAGWNTEAAQEAVNQGFAELGTPLRGGRVRLVLVSLLMFLAAMLRQHTRIGFGRARGQRRTRASVITGLHEAAVYTSVIAMRRDLVLVHNLRAMYWATKLGHGRRYALSQSSFGLLAAGLGLRRAALRAFARANADPASESPSVRAVASLYRGAGFYAGGLDNGLDWIAESEAHGQWLEVASDLDAVAVFNQNACAAGRTSEAEYWLARGRRRLSGRGEDVTSFIGAAPMTFALQGRSAEAGTELRRVEELCAHYSARSLSVVRLMATVFVLVEQNELGAPFEQAVAQFEALKLRPVLMLRFHRPIHYYIAAGRLAQLRAAGDAERPQRLALARAAVAQTQKNARTDELRAMAGLARADLLVQEGHPEQALRVLGGLDLFQEPDAPTVAFEVARIRARALSALGSEEAGRQARLAASIAAAENWPHRGAGVAMEFALPQDERGGPSGQGTHGGTYTGGHERQRLQALQQVSAAASRVLDPKVLARITLDETIRILAADRAFLFLTDGTSGALSEHLGRDSAGRDIPHLTGYSTSLVEKVRLTGELQVVTGTEEGAALGAQSIIRYGLRSILVAPMQLDGRLLGVVYLDSQVAKGIFTADDFGIITALTNYIASSMETARAAQLEISVQTAQRQRDLADTLREALQKMSELLDPVDVIKQLLESTAFVLGSDQALILQATDSECTLLAVDPGSGELVMQAISEDARLRSLLTLERPRIGGTESVPAALKERLRAATSWIALPLRSSGADLGVLVLASSAATSLSDSLEVAAVLAAQGMTAHDKATLFKQVQELSVVDELTGIANRRRFFEVASRDVASASRHGRQVTALMIDIDHFKRVNDTYGHPTGDDVIKEVATRLSAQVRQTDVIGRYGGEEFAVLLQDSGPGSDLPERLRAGVGDQPIKTRSGPIKVTVSIGLAYLTEDDLDVESLLARADQGLYKAKERGRNRVCVEEKAPLGTP